VTSEEDAQPAFGSGSSPLLFGDSNFHNIGYNEREDAINLFGNTGAATVPGLPPLCMDSSDIDHASSVPLPSPNRYNTPYEENPWGQQSEEAALDDARSVASGLVEKYQMKEFEMEKRKLEDERAAFEEQKKTAELKEKQRANMEKKNMKTLQKATLAASQGQQQGIGAASTAVVAVAQANKKRVSCWCGACGFKYSCLLYSH
jgi:hypothetical protein